jgi:hypothetical protein
MRYFLGDAARVTNGRARLSIVGATAQIAMRDGTVLRFRGKPGEIRISVAQCAIDLSGNGSYALDGGAVAGYSNCRVAIPRGQPAARVGWRVTAKAIARVLRKAGYAPVHRKGRPVGDRAGPVE